MSGVLAKYMTQIRFIAGAVALAFIISVATPVLAQQPSSVNPTASSVKEQQLLQELTRIQGRGSIPDAKSYVLEQPAGHFNAGQKMIYWIVVLGGGASAVTGYLLLFPFYGTEIAGMQLSEIIHSVVAMLFIAAMLGHIYIGTIGMEGAFEAMGEGTVDVNWAREHHRLWLDDELARGTSSAAERSAAAARPAE